MGMKKNSLKLKNLNNKNFSKPRIGLKTNLTEKMAIAAGKKNLTKFNNFLVDLMYKKNTKQDPIVQAIQPARPPLKMRKMNKIMTA